MFQKLKNKKKIGIHILAWACFGTLILLQTYQVNAKITNRIFLGAILNVFVFYFNYGYLVPKFLLKKRTFTYFSLVTLLIVLPLLVIKTVLPVEDFNVPMVGTRGLAPRQGVFPILFSTAFIITGTALRMYDEWIVNERNKREIAAKQNLTKLESLKNQLNPHFLFNSLNSIYSLTSKKSDDAPEAVITLSELMRYMLYNTEDDYVPLQRELDYIKNYIKLQRLRIAGNENVKINIRGDVQTQRISPLLFISFIENAFKYGTDFKGNTEVVIEINVAGNDFRFRCVNLIGTKKKDKENSGIGLKNTRERMQLLYPDKHELIVKEENNRFVVDLKLKLD